MSIAGTLHGVGETGQADDRRGVSSRRLLREFSRLMHIDYDSNGTQSIVQSRVTLIVIILVERFSATCYEKL